jgi:hypothetical protein
MVERNKRILTTGKIYCLILFVRSLETIHNGENRGPCSAGYAVRLSSESGQNSRESEKCSVTAWFRRSASLKPGDDARMFAYFMPISCTHKRHREAIRGQQKHAANTWRQSR